jgi:hypothetical protein
MVEDARKLLLSRGFSLSRRGQPGHLALENLWSYFPQVDGRICA